MAGTLPWLLSGAAIVGILLRLTLRDRIPGIPAHWFYATPPVVLTGMLLAAALAWLSGRRARRAALCASAGLACAAWAWQTGWQASPAMGAAGGTRVVLWNIARGSRGWENNAAELRALSADIIGLVEAGQDAPGMLAFWSDALPEYSGVVAPTGLTLLARGPVEPISASTMEPWGRHLHARVWTDDGPLHVVVFDLSHSMFRSRWTALEPLMQLLEPLRGERVLVLGDFNTPPDSVYFEPLRRGFVNAFEEVGHGYAATWPVPVPVLTLDQAWASPSVPLARAELGWSRFSDHRPLLLELGR